jgi:hypothetical protein
MARYGSVIQISLGRRRIGEDVISARLRLVCERFFAGPVDLVAALEADPGRTLDALATDPSSFAPLRVKPGSPVYRRLHARLLKDSLRIVQGIILADKLAEARRRR